MKKWHKIVATVAGVVGAGIIGASATLTPTNCHYTGTTQFTVRPDTICTPGVIESSLTKERICNPTFRTTTIRNVTEAEKNQVYKEYGITSHKPGEYEIDHLISLELGGSNDIHNLWPELGFPNPKDKIENLCHQKVCSGQITLQQAQQQISTNWQTACQ